MQRPPLSPSRIAERASKRRDACCLTDDDRGVTAIEYALIAALIGLAFVALITQIGDFVSTPFETVASYL